MAWNPKKYNEFKTVRDEPFFDLISLVDEKPNLSVIDLGCGTGELTNVLAEKLANATIKGIDSSEAMLSETSKFSNITFQNKTIEAQISENERFDLVISNAAIQWVDNHEKLFPDIISLLNPGGQLAIQMPNQNENILNRILLKIVQSEPHRTNLNGYKRLYPVLKIDEYAQLLFQAGGRDLVVFEKIYPLVVNSVDELYDFISGSALVPYFERLDEGAKAVFISDFKSGIAEQFPKMPALYAFKRILMSAGF